MIVIIIRLLIPIAIVRSPWWGMVAALGIDAIGLELIRLIGYCLGSEIKWTRTPRFV
jgi:hypothetical protein